MRHGLQLASKSIALTLVGMILLTGCAASGQNGQPNEAASTASTGTPVTPNATPSATATAVSTEFKFATADGSAQNVQIPKLPETAKKFSKEGLIAFAEHWYATLTYLYASGDKTPIMAVSSSDCDFCVRASEETSKGYKGGNWIVGGQQALYSNTTDFMEYPRRCLLRQVRAAGNKTHLLQQRWDCCERSAAEISFSNSHGCEVH